MKKLFLVVMVIVLFLGCKKDSTEYIGNWIKKSDFEGIPRGNAVSFVLGDKVYFGTGYNSSEDDEYLKDFWMYDTTRDFWTKLTEFPGEARIGGVAFTINGKGYMGLGYNGKVKLKDFWEFDPATNLWTRKADFGGSARYGAVGFSLANKGYLGTGYDDNDNRDFWEYDPTTNQWVQIASMGGSKRQDAVAFTINEKAYVCTGINNGSNLTDLWQFDPATGAWIQKADIDYDDSWTITRSNGTAFTLGSKSYVGLGYSSGVRNDFWEYDPTADTWTNKTAFEGSARQDAVSFVVNSRAYVASGRSGSYYFDDIWEFKPNDEVDTDD
ncbi:MAG TPA: kelch repeat-containing protein [Prolixibacteraceae bacterium]|nr:kelch repeat-containing protein [Prolixibacteraceae bacterium]